MDKQKIIQALQDYNKDAFPFKTQFSVHILLAHLKQVYQAEKLELLIDWKRCEQLGFTDGSCAPEVYLQEFDLVESIFRAFLSPAMKELIPIAISLPFRPQAVIWASDIISEGVASKREAFKKNGDAVDFKNSIIQTAYTMILVRYYKQKIPTLITKTLLTTTDAHGFLDYWNFNFLMQFSEVVPHNPPPMTEQLSTALLAAMNNPEELLRLLPPHHFSISGFSWMYCTRANAEELTSQIQSELVKFGTLVDQKRVQNLDRLFQQLYRSRNINVGLVFFWGKELLVITHKGQFKNHCPVMDSVHISLDSITGSEIETALNTGEVCTLTGIDDKAKYSNLFIQGMAETGLKVASIIPISDSEGNIGFVIVGSSEPSDINARSSQILSEMKPWFVGAMKQTMSDRKRQTEEIIKSEYTSVHPTLEWRLQQAAREIIVKRQRDPFARSDEIEFRDIYPLFGSSDIRASTQLRNEAVRMDLSMQLTIGRDILTKVSRLREFPMVEMSLAKMNQFLKKISENIHAGDEMDISHFIVSELHPQMSSLEKINSTMAELIGRYWQKLDTVHHSMYTERHKFEDSVERINQVMSRYADELQKKAQIIYPHFFEKHVTDGLDHDIYVGSSLLENGGEFDQFFLKNIRLWQIQMMCGLAAVTAKVKNDLPIALETAHLLVVQHNPITVFFDTEEKQLAVKGAYNIRYEIMKKRIDKVRIREYVGRSIFA